MERGYWKVKEWFFDKVNETCKGYGRALVGEYKNGQLDHTILRVNEVVAETEKAFKVKLDAETFGGHWVEWTAWVPKSVIEA